MIAAFFHDECFTRDAAGTYYSTSLPYKALARYLEHFERLVVVGRLGKPKGATRTVSSGEGVEWACVETSQLSPRFLPAVSLRAREVLARVDCAIVHLPGILGLIACREAVGSGTPWMVEVVGDVFDALWNHGSLKGKVAAAPLHVLTRHYIKQAPFAIYVARAISRAYPPGGTSVIASDVVIDLPRADVLERRLARIDARDGEAPAKLGLVGSYDVNYKGHETALRAVSLLQRSRRPVLLRCIGAGDPTRWRARAAALGVEQHVEFGRVLPHGAQVIEWLDSLDLCLVPSLTEGLPRVLVEAMSRALPAVGSRAGGIPELLDAHRLHRPGDPRALASLVGALLDSRDEMKAEALRNWRAASEYAADVLAARRSRMLEQLKAAARAQARGGGHGPGLGARDASAARGATDLRGARF